MLGFSTSCPSCGHRMPRRVFTTHVCAHVRLPLPRRLDVVCPGIVQAESGTMYLSPSLLMAAARHTGTVDTDALASLLGEIIRAVELPVVQ